MAEEKLMTRDQVPEEHTWDLTPLFADLEAFEASFKQAKDELEKIKSFEGKVGESAETFQAAIEQLLKAERIVENLYVYASLKNDQDQSNDTYQTLEARMGQLYSEFVQAVAYFEPEVLAIDEAKIQEFLAANPNLEGYKKFIDNIGRFRPHTLSPNEELLIASATEIFAASEKTFSLLNNADLKFPTIQDDEGKNIPLSHSVYAKCLESTDRRLRKDAFQGLYSAFDQFKNTFASTLSTQIKTHNYIAKVRNYPSARAAALYANNVPEAVYDTLLEAVHERLDLLHRYVSLRKSLLKIDDLEMYDIYTPLLGEAPISFNYEEAKALILEAVQPMGAEYVAIIEEAFNERWIDLYENQGKRSGAYSSGTYDSKPYILMNWQDTLDQLYTMIHELGHSAHSYLSRKNQPYVYGGYPIFLAEIASTTNENLLTFHLLNKYQDPAIRAYVINHFLDGVKGSVFRQTQFAEFEHFMHQSDAEGKPLTQQFLSDFYRDLNARYYGPDVNSDSEIAIEWARIPHFYYNYYVFQYSTGFSAAVFFADRIFRGEEGALEKYLGFLKSGNSQYPIDTMKAAGLDMTQKDYILACLDVFEARLNEFEELVKNM